MTRSSSSPASTSGAGPENGSTYAGPPNDARLVRGERIVVDEAGMLDLGAQLSGRTFDMATVHRFSDPEYADLMVRMRSGENPALLFDRLHALGRVVLYASTEGVQEVIARIARDGDAITAATDDEVRELNARIRDERVREGGVPQTTNGISSWAEAVAGQQADTDRRVMETRQDAEHARREQRQLVQHHADARAALKQRSFGRPRPQPVAALRFFPNVSAAPYTRCMALKADEVYAAGLKLDLDERTVVAHRLLASLQPEEGSEQVEVDAAWREEIGSRVDDILNGKVELGSFEETRAKARALLDELRK